MRQYDNENEKNYLLFGDEFIYIDFDEVLNAIRLDAPLSINEEEEEEEEEENDEGNNDSINVSEELTSDSIVTIDMTKWEMVNKMVDCILHNYEEQDSALGKKNLEKLPINFKIAYNTLLKYNIIKTVD